MAPHSHSSQRRTRFRLFPKNWNDGTLFYVVLLIAAAASLIMVGLSIHRNHLKAQHAEKQLLDNADWREKLIPPQATLIDLLLRDVNQDRSIVLFENGTVVLVEEPTKDTLAAAKEILKNLDQPDQRFAVTRADDDYVVRYDSPAFTRISNDAVNSQRKWILKFGDQYTSEAERERLKTLSEKNLLSTHLGFVARSFLRDDIADQKATKVLKAR